MENLHLSKSKRRTIDVENTEQVKAEVERADKFHEATCNCHEDKIDFPTNNGCLNDSTKRASIEPPLIKQKQQNQSRTLLVSKSDILLNDIRYILHLRKDIQKLELACQFNKNNKANGTASKRRTEFVKEAVSRVHHKSTDTTLDALIKELDGTDTDVDHSNSLWEEIQSSEIAHGSKSSQMRNSMNDYWNQYRSGFPNDSEDCLKMRRELWKYGVTHLPTNLTI